MGHEKRDDWMRDVEQRQRNIVFPDTAANEARFWRGLSATKLTLPQIVGIVLMVAGPVTIILLTGWDKFRHEPPSHNFLARLLGAFGDWFLWAIFFGLLFLLMRWGIRRVSRSRPPRPS